MLRGLGLGALAGLGWGAVARLFMRLLTDDPQFSWSGTLFILGLATAAGACVGMVLGARASGRSGWWRLAALPALALFAGPGSLLAPAVLGMAAVLRGRTVVRVLGTLLVTVPPVVLASDPAVSPTPTQLVGTALMLLSAAPLGWALGRVAGRWGPGPVAHQGVTADPVEAMAPAPVPA